MKFFFISEHYEPRIGGVTTYIRETCKALTALGYEVTLAVPGENKTGTVNERESYGFKVLEFGTDIILTKDISSEIRIKFCSDITRYLSENNRLDDYDVIHNLFGLYLMRYFDHSFLKKANKKVGVTIHNIPPEECGTSWKGDKLISYTKDIVRKELVRAVNKKRIKTQEFDTYVVPSGMVKEKLSQYIKGQDIHVIGHGGASKDYKTKSNTATTLKFLTVAGFVPHKNQHFIPEIAQKLKAEGIDFVWNVVGPNKHKRYVEYIQNRCKKLNVEDVVKLHFSVPYPTLVSFYQNADLYLQMSSEEGFCITTLDAAYYGIPIIGTRAGAIPEIIEHSRGKVVDTNAKAVSKGILEYIRSTSFRNENDNIEELVGKVASIYNWEASAKKLVQVYK